jgi:hypothetical protein
MRFVMKVGEEEILEISASYSVWKLYIPSVQQNAEYGI